MGTLSALITDSSEGAFLPIHLSLCFPSIHTSGPQHILYSMIEECGVRPGLLMSPQEASPPLKSRTFLKKTKKRKKEKRGLPISPRSSSVQPDVSYINVLFCLFILVGGLSSLPHHPCPIPVCPWEQLGWGLWVFLNPLLSFCWLSLQLAVLLFNIAPKVF